MKLQGGQFLHSRYYYYYNYYYYYLDIQILSVGRPAKQYNIIIYLSKKKRVGRAR